MIVFGMVLALAEEGRFRLATFVRSARGLLQYLPQPGFRFPDIQGPKANRSEE
jgi:hypothetical protein